MNRKQWYINRIVETHHEFLAAEASVCLLEARLRANPSFLAPWGVERRVARELRRNLESTYLIRLFAAFEGGMRDAWSNKWNKATEPPMRDLIDSIGGRRAVPGNIVFRVHSVREYRNSLVHAGATHEGTIKIYDCQRWINEYFTRLPKDW